MHLIDLVDYYKHTKYIYTQFDTRHFGFFLNQNTSDTFLRKYIRQPQRYVFTSIVS